MTFIHLSSIKMMKMKMKTLLVSFILAMMMVMYFFQPPTLHPQGWGAWFLKSNYFICLWLFKPE
jgi:hypothetical protein